MSSYVNQEAISDDDDDDDDDDNDDELFLQNGWPTKDFYVLFPAGAIVRDSQHCKYQTCHTSMVWTCTESEFRLCWMKLCSSGRRCATAPQNDHSTIK